MSKREKALSLLSLNAPTIVEFAGEKFAIKAPSVADRSRILAAGGANPDGSVKDLGKMQVAATIACVLDPETNAPCFKPEDEEALLQAPSGGLVDVLSRHVMARMGEGSSNPKA